MFHVLHGSRAHLRARHSLLRPSARCLSRRSWRYGKLYASSQRPAAKKHKYKIEGKKSHRREKRRIYKSRNNSQLAAAAVMVPLSVWGVGWGCRPRLRRHRGGKKGLRRGKKTRLFIYFSLETSAMFGTGDWRNNVAPVLVVVSLFPTPARFATASSAGWWWWWGGIFGRLMRLFPFALSSRVRNLDRNGGGGVKK